MKTMRHDAPTELTIHARELRELFSEREFDPLVDHGDVLSSIAQIALPLAVETLVIAAWVIMWQPRGYAHSWTAADPAAGADVSHDRLDARYHRSGPRMKTRTRECTMKQPPRVERRKRRPSSPAEEPPYHDAR
jgi:hypothetical protein